MVTFFPRRRKRSPIARRRPGRPRSGQVVNRVGLSELTPELSRYLGQAAYLQLSFFESLSRALAVAPSLSSKEAISRVAAVTLERHHGLVAELEGIGLVPGEAMEPFASAIDEFQHRTRGSDWFESLLGYHVASGILDDGFAAIAEGLEGDYGTRMPQLLSVAQPHAIVTAELRSALEANPKLASRLALYGRRLVGDVLLVARSALALPDDTAPDDEHLEPVLTELIAAHTRRMDDLGLTA